MADKITSLEKLCDQWDVSYTVEKNSLFNSFCVVVLKADMTDPDSDTEARTLANAIAATIKDAWSATAPDVTPFVSPTTPEDVTL